ncbi:MAG: DUF2332 domain-containing protein [Gammaproteobacteria bacterium]
MNEPNPNPPPAGVDDARLAAAAADVRERVTSYRYFDAPLYAALAERLAQDRDLLALVARVRAGQPYCYFFMNAVHAALMERPGEPLAAFYASLTPAPRPPGEAWPVFREFCLRHAARILEILATRTVQTTFVDRAAVVLLALDHVARRAGAPLTLIEVGCSAGLMLLFDEYRYDFGTGGTLGDPDAPLCLAPRFLGTAPQAPARMPKIRARTGIDLLAFDPHSREQCEWIDAMMFADWVEPRRRLRAALELRRRRTLDVVVGDALEHLPRLIAAAGGPVCVLHANCLYQWPAEAVARFERLLCDAARERPFDRVSIEWPYYWPRTRLDAVYARGEVPPTEILHSAYAAGAAGPATLLGTCEGNARWIRWGG